MAAGLLGNRQRTNKPVNTLVYLLQNQMLQMAFSLSPYDMQLTFDEKLNNFCENLMSSVPVSFLR